jgi:hypothetical protein
MRVELFLSCLVLFSALSLNAAAVSSLKGLLSRSRPIPGLSGWNPQLNWADLEPSEGRFNFAVVDSALASRLPVRLRVWAGVYAPNWLKSKLGTVGVQNDQTNAKETMVPYWRSTVAAQYWSYYEKMQVALRAHIGESNPLIRGIQISGTMFVYSEPFLHQFKSAYTRQYVLASGWTAKRDKAAQIKCLDIHKKVWKKIPQLFAFNSYQYVKGNNVRMDPKYVKKFIKSLRSRFGKRAVIANHSIRESYIGLHKSKKSCYFYLKKKGPLYFQTATWDRIAKKGSRASNKQRHAALVKVINWAIAMGAEAVELPEGNNLTAKEIKAFTRKLKKN